MTSKFATSNTEFGLNLLRAAYEASAKESGDKRHTVQISPFSTRRALSMAGIGARGATRRSILDTLCYPSTVDFREVNEDNKAFVAALLKAEERAKAKTDILVANALWLNNLRDDVEFVQAFIDENVAYYDAAVERLAFDDAGLDRINGWCKEKTREKISKILEQFPEDAEAFLTDALYIKTPSKKQFRRRLDEQGKFKLLDGTTRDITFMSQHGDFNVFKGDGVQILQFPFGEFGTFSYYVILPDEDSSLTAVVNSLTGTKWAQWKSQLEEGSGQFRIAQNEQEFSTDFKDNLIALGMGNAFSDDLADFLDMCNVRLKIGAVKHKTYTKFTHKGFEGAAVTAVGMVRCTSIGMPKPRFDITVDRPYAWLVEGRDEILFAATTTNPVEPKEQDKDDDESDVW